MSLGIDLRHEARHGSKGACADEFERRLECLYRAAFSEEAAQKISEAVELPPIANIEGKIADLRKLGFTDPVKMITSLPAILGYAKERLNIVAATVAGLDDRRDSMVSQLISKRREIIEKVHAASPKCWRDVRKILLAA